MTRFRSVSVSALAATFVLLLAVAASAQDIFPRILNGSPTEDFESVGIVGDQFGGFCSGTLISPRHVLTAGHCAEVMASSTAGTFELDSGVYTTSAIYIHPDFNFNTLDNDIAILELSEPVVEEPSPVFGGIKPDGDPLIGGEELIIVGFGGGGGAEGSDGNFGEKMFGFVTIDVAMPTLLIWTFDDPTESNTAPGDSGGPGFLEIDGELFVASITSGGSLADAALGDVAFNTRVDAYLDWIDGVISSLPEDPGEGPPGPIEETGDCPLLEFLTQLQCLTDLLVQWCGLDQIAPTVQSSLSPFRGLGWLKNPDRGNRNNGNRFGFAGFQGPKRRGGG